MLTFTGSTEIGKILIEQCAKTVKKVGMELGGNAPFIVFDDADLEKAVIGAMASKFRNAGQTCVCANRIYVQDGVYDKFAEMLAGRGREAQGWRRLGFWRDDGSAHQQGGRRKGRGAHRGCARQGRQDRRRRQAPKQGGNFFEPTVLANVTPKMKISIEETFGPVAPLFRFKTEEEVIKLANDTEFGLASYFYSRDIGRCWRVGEALEYGIVGINEGIISSEVVPFGGVKESRASAARAPTTASRSSSR